MKTARQIGEDYAKKMTIIARSTDVDSYCAHRKLLKIDISVKFYTFSTYNYSIVCFFCSTFAMIFEQLTLKIQRL